MRTPSFLSDQLRDLLLRNSIATLPELKQAMGTFVDVTVFRKLKELSYLTSYSHRGRLYTLDQRALRGRNPGVVADFRAAVRVAVKRGVVATGSGKISNGVAVGGLVIPKRE